MEITSFLAECLSECVSSYGGIEGYDRQEYIVQKGYDALEEELKVKDYLVNLVKCVNKHVFNSHVLSEDVDRKISFSEIMKIDSAKNEKYPHDKIKEMYSAIFDALKEFHDNYVYNKKVNVRESIKSRRPISNKKFDELNESEFARDYFLFTFIAKPFIARIQAKSNYAYEEYVLDNDVREYYKNYMGESYKESEIKLEEESSIDDSALLEVLLNEGFKYEFDEKRRMMDISNLESSLKKVEFPSCINNRVLDSYTCCFYDMDIESEGKLPIEEVIFNSERVGIYSSFVGCPNLKKVVVKGELIAVDSQSFIGCDLIRTNEDDINYIKINDNAYYVARNLEETEKEYLMINEDTHLIASFFAEYANESILDLANVRYIMDYAFCGNDNLEKVIMSKHIKYIGECAFMDCGNLKEIEFPRSLKVIENSAFLMTGLKSVKVPLNCKVSEEAFPKDCKIERY